MFSEVLTSHAVKGSSDTASQSRAGTRRGQSRNSSLKFVRSLISVVVGAEVFDGEIRLLFHLLGILKNLWWCILFDRGCAFCMENLQRRKGCRKISGLGNS
jgi:hypothetical protein